MSKIKEYTILAGLLLLTVIVRMLHLLDSSVAQPLCNPDSWWFRHAANSPDYNEIWKSGLIYPIRYLGDTGAIFLPPLLSVATALVIYFLAKKMYNTKVALFSVFAFSCAMLAWILGASGNIDRDALSLLLITSALAIWHFSKTWKGAVGIAVVALALAIEWSWAGVVILLVIITVSWLAEWKVEGKPNRLQVIGTLAGIGFVIVPLFSNAIRSTISANLKEITSLEAVGELQSLSVIDLFPYLILGFPLIYGALLCYKRLNRNDIFVFTWIGTSIALGLIASRLSIYMVPAICVLAGIGFAYITETDWMPYRKLILGMSVVLVLISGISAYWLPSNFTMSKDWEKALTWIKENTGEDHRIASWWDYGFWIIDVGEREAVVNNSDHRLLDAQIAFLYTTNDENAAVQTMRDLDAQYLIFSKREADIWLAITNKSKQDPDDGLYKRVSRGENLSRFDVAYANKTVTILRPCG